MSAETKTNMADRLRTADRGSAQLNPHPTSGYRIRMKVKNAPGPFEVVRMGGQYDVRNEDKCGEVNPMTGMPGRITSMEIIPVRHVSMGQYEGVVYLDAMQDDDYYGRGECSWELSRAYVVLIAQDEGKDTRFSMSLSLKSIVEGGSEKRFFTHADYPRIDNLDSYPASSKESPEGFLPEYRANLFAVALTSLGAVE